MDLIIITVSTLAIVGSKFSSRYKSITTTLHFLIIAFIVIAGLSHTDASNFRPFAPFGIHAWPQSFRHSLLLCLCQLQRCLHNG